MTQTLSRRLALLSMAVSVAALGACASTRTTENPGEYVADTVITGQVKAAVLAEPTLKSAEINVETFKGRVQLSGFVSSRADMDRAMKVAREVKGVTSVANDMRLK